MYGRAELHRWRQCVSLHILSCVWHTAIDCVAAFCMLTWRRRYCSCATGHESQAVQDAFKSRTCTRGLVARRLVACSCCPNRSWARPHTLCTRAPHDSARIANADAQASGRLRYTRAMSLLARSRAAAPRPQAPSALLHHTRARIIAPPASSPSLAPSPLHVADDGVRVLRRGGAAAEVFRAVLVVCDRLEARGLDHVRLVDHVQVAQHHDAREQQRGGVGQVLALHGVTDERRHSVVRRASRCMCEALTALR